MERKTLEKNLFQWKNSDIGFELSQTYYDVEFIIDFGVFKKGDKFPCVFLDYELGIIEAFNNKAEFSYSNMEKEQYFTLTPIEEPTND